MPTTTAPTTATTSTQMQISGFATTAIPVTGHKLATGQFAEVSNPTARPQNGGHPSVQSLPPLEDIPKAPVRQGTPCPNAESTFREPVWNQKDWPLPPTPVPTSALPWRKKHHPRWSLPDKLQRIAYGDHTAPYVKRMENMRRTGIAIYKTHQECCPRMHNNPSHRVFSILSPSTPSCRMLSSPSHWISSAPSPKPFSTPATEPSAPPTAKQPTVIWCSWQICRTDKT